MAAEPSPTPTGEAVILTRLIRPDENSLTPETARDFGFGMTNGQTPTVGCKSTQ
jgi:hypothetical protein